MLCLQKKLRYQILIIRKSGKIISIIYADIESLLEKWMDEKKKNPEKPLQQMEMKIFQFFVVYNIVIERCKI